MVSTLTDEKRVAIAEKFADIKAIQNEQRRLDEYKDEESTLFASMHKNFSPEKRERLATKFKAKKQELQAQP